METARLHAEPGGQAELPVKLRNPGRLVESFRMDVVGLDPSWWQVHPPELNVYPGAEESAVVVLTPPTTAHADEALPFAVRAVSTLDAERAVAEEGDLEIGRIDDLQAAITPVTSHGRWSGRHTLTFTNRGNAVVPLRLSARDEEEELGFRIDPEQVVVPVGGSATARLQVRPRKPFLRGAPVRRPFRVVSETDPERSTARGGVSDPSRPVLDGAIRQLAVLSRGAVLLGVLLVAAMAGLVMVVTTATTVKGARKADIRPEPPIGLVAEAVAPEKIQLRWQPTDRAEHYRVEQVNEGDPGVLQVVEVPDGATAIAMQVDKPLTHACYQVKAVRGTLISDALAAQCVTTPDGPVSPPTGAAATTVLAGPPTSATDTTRGVNTPNVPQADSKAPPAPTPPAPAPPAPAPPAPAPLAPAPLAPAPPAPTGLTASRRNMSGSTGIALTWSAPVDPAWSITGYQVRTGTSTSTVSDATEFLDPDSTHYCAPDTTYQVTTTATLTGTATSAESKPVTVTVPDPVDCTYPTQITSVNANPGGSVTVQAVCQTDLRGPEQNTDIAVLVDDAVKETQRCNEGADPTHLDDLHTFVVTGLDPATTYTVTTRTTSPSGSKFSEPFPITTA